MSDNFLDSINLSSTTGWQEEYTVGKEKSDSLALQRMTNTYEKQSKKHSKPGPKAVNPKKIVSFSLDTALVTVLEKYSLEHDISKSFIVRNGLKNYLEKELNLEIEREDYRNMND